MSTPPCRRTRRAATSRSPISVSRGTRCPVDSQPIDAALLPRLTALLAVDREQPPAPGLAGFARVSPPGPGDDTGTLVVWADGVARWTSDSGNLDVWLVDEPITYNWVC